MLKFLLTFILLNTFSITSSATQNNVLLNTQMNGIMGYFYSKPIPTDEMEMYLKKSKFTTAEL